MATEPAAPGRPGQLRSVSVKQKPKGDREHGHADANPDPHKSIRDHLQKIYSWDETMTAELPFQAITTEELKLAVCLGVSVCQDGTS